MSICEIFKPLGLESYSQIFCDEGFETWESLLDITEDDLEALGVKRGHRRRLQREIATCRGVPKDTPLNITLSPHDEDAESTWSSSVHSQTSLDDKILPPVMELPSKRKYRHHPKPDINAPMKPLSAYVSFANLVREELKAQNISFTEMAKIVGNQWKSLPLDIRDAKDSEAAIQKEVYLNSLKAYRKTKQYQLYKAYLAEFKSKYGRDGTDSLRKCSKNADLTSVPYPPTQDTPQIPVDKPPRLILGHCEPSRPTTSSKCGSGYETQIILPPIRGLERYSFGTEWGMFSPPLRSSFADCVIGTDTSASYSNDMTPINEEKSQYSFLLPAIKGSPGLRHIL
ncbi:High mobility group protein 20A [Neolecta irregularis DAH-3]|uniref:High mobility group protein 20A n=1 Tax=Neolecta irregularis (strain DAH-3) TaxID=1198029 RepID=A0A1U7LRH2_NEOID|nr:High mobility group protein 20A [Neolecta irregularis DAH-3]|eukprot:OLL25257.1 High mobility group protein 20A [Neolecta irregularis DAH-3]